MRTVMIKNSRMKPIVFWLEPWAEQFEIGPGSMLELRYECSILSAADPELVVTEDLFVWWFGSGCRVQVHIDGEDVTSPASWTIQSP